MREGRTPGAFHHSAKGWRVAPRCLWWPYVWSVRSQTCVGTDGRIAIAAQRLHIEKPPGTRVTRCIHPNGDHSVLRALPAKDQLPVVLLHCPAPAQCPALPHAFVLL